MAVLYAEVIGDPIAHSKSPLIHKFWLGKLGIEGDYRAVRVTPDELADYLDQRSADPDWRGCNVTRPLKEHAVRVAGPPGNASFVKAVNTIGIFRDDDERNPPDLVAFNTDVAGLVELLQNRGLRPASVVVIGAGGAARAAVATALLLGVEKLTIMNRNELRAREMIASLLEARRNDARIIAWWSVDPNYEPPPPPEDPNVQVISIDQRLPGADLVINATPLGMTGEIPLPLSLAELATGVTVLDMVYDPIETRFLADARERGLETIDGLEMLVEQAAMAFRIFFGDPAPREYDAELRELLTR